MKRHKTVEAFISDTGQWEESVILLREIILSTPVRETVKWCAPTYTIDNKNVIGIGAFKSYVGIWFHQGVFLKDKKNKLINAQEGTTKGLRQWRFESIEEIRKEAATIKAYIEEAIENQQQGKELRVVKNKPLIIPEELQSALQTDQSLKAAFDQFTRGRQREFTDYIGSAKRPETRLNRLKKCIPMILNGISPNDKYRK